MKYTPSFHASSAVLGAVAVTLAFILTSQTTPPAQTTWPPPKSMILNVFEYPPAITVPGGGTYSVLTVPTDRWLTITGANMVQGAVGGLPMWAELTSSGVLTSKGFAAGNSPPYSPPDCGGPIGWTFAPGSSVVLWNNPGQSGASGPMTIALYSLVGYYSRN